MTGHDLTTINQLHIRAAGAGDPLAVQQRAAALLGAASLQPPSLPPAAILYVRSLRDPLPGGLDLARRGVRPAPRWERAAVAALDAAVRRAARPALGMAPADADAVLFRDRAEWLAALAGDWLHGLLALHWWWRGFLQGRDGSRAVLAAWLDAPEDAPAALAHLARRGEARPFVQALPPMGVQALLDRIVYCHGLPGLQRALAAGPPDSAAAARPPGDGSGDHAAPPPPEQPPPAPPSAPWAAWTAGLRLDDLPLDAQGLLGIGLTVHHARPVARSSGFAQQVAAWCAAQPAAQATVARMQAHAVAGSRAGLAAGGHLPAAAADVLAPLASAPPAVTEPAPPQMPAPPATTPRADGPPAASLLAPLPHPDAADPPVAVAPALAPAAPAPGPPPLDAGDWLWAGDEEFPTAEEVQTAFGGVFYLINLGIHLGYYADFTTPLTPGIGLSIYDFVALVAEALLAANAAELHADPVWGLLAALAGRSAGQRPGHDFVTPTGEPLAGWLAAQMAQIRPRLAEALDLAAESPVAADTAPDSLPDLLCRHAARVVVSATRLDIHLALADLPIQVRLSGLDRDPGWVPAAGRTITFFFA